MIGFTAALTLMTTLAFPAVIWAIAHAPVGR